nr:N-acetyltransferase [Falsirhodobacter halotolerans]
MRHLRSEGAVAAERVAEHGGEITGAALLARLEAPFPALALAPIAVAPMWQGQGIGADLVRAALSAAEGAAVFVLGDPAYYGRFGFSAERAAGYVCAYAGPAFLVHGPQDMPATGRILFPQAFSGL